MLINLSNHPSAQWDLNQKQAAESSYGKVVDIAFPAVDPEKGEEYIAQLAGEYLLRVKEWFVKQPDSKNFAVHIMGELTFCFALVNLLIKNNIRCVASTTRRISKPTESGEKISSFSFVMFREYLP